jgi:hypothetical protein
MSLGEVNRGAVLLIIVLLIGASGYLWYSQLYTPAVAEQATAKTTADTAAAGLTAAQQELAAATERVEQSKKDAGAVDDSVSRLALARKAIPTKDLIDDAAIVLMDLANTASIRTSFSAGDEDGGSSGSIDATAGSSLQGATPIDLEFKAAGTYREMMYFMSLVEGTIEAKDGKLYARDRLFNVVKLEIGTETTEEGSSGGFGSTEEADPTVLVARPGEMIFTVTVRMYTSTTENAQGVGAADAAAQAAAGTAGGAAAGTDPGAAAGAAGAGASPTGQDPNAAAGTNTGAATGTGAPASTGGASTPAPAAGAPAGGGI